MRASLREAEIMDRYIAAMTYAADYDDPVWERLEGMYINHAEYRGRFRVWYRESFAEQFDAYYLVFASALLADCAEGAAA